MCLIFSGISIDKKITPKGQQGVIPVYTEFKLNVFCLYKFSPVKISLFKDNQHLEF